jgi:hypothetical protein
VARGRCDRTRRPPRPRRRPPRYRRFATQRRPIGAGLSRSRRTPAITCSKRTWPDRLVPAGRDSPTSQRTFWECQTSFQGIAVGWVDQYHQSLPGQTLDLTDVPNADDYYLVSTANYAGIFLEQDYTNNTAWVKFRLYRDSSGNRKVEVTDHSQCDSPGLCGVGAPNR